jgi:hypothetical protein
MWADDRQVAHTRVKRARHGTDTGVCGQEAIRMQG